MERHGVAWYPFSCGTHRSSHIGVTRCNKPSASRLGASWAPAL
ncbi:hypothetical protein MBEBAB_0560 [Brevundimonas abyssalis TAR-001]|uniref:Uncharacterized protein n=1 Tax=Brevundimonas abyssalis TAR-001 TaxID=1391729 RepID=A0A8E0KJD1_9CAUL|nr:hypothetical protein MBEBAB_0560 [Brevundimonas abyssalis TAR-001]